VIEAHHEQTELVQLVFADTSLGGDAVSKHVAGCAECRGAVDMLRTEANVMRLAAVPAIDETGDCLDDESIAAFAQGNVGSADAASAVTHLLTCARCREEVASVARLLDAPEVKSEIERLAEHPGGKHRRHLLRVLFVAGALAAGLLIMLVPGSSQLAKRLYREESVTGAAAPRLVAPVGTMTASDAFRWTSVPRADRYRITVFARDGSVIWEAQTRDTSIAALDHLVRAPSDTILWRVEAHVGWEDRWASSDLAMLTFARSLR